MKFLESIRFILKPDSTFFENYHANLTVMNYGCGNRKAKNEIGVDLSNNSDADIIIKEDNSIPIDTASIDLIISRYVFEHIKNLDETLSELERTLKPGGELRFCVPHALSIDAFDDPTHCRFYTLRTMNYFIGVSDVHYATSKFDLQRPYLRLTLAWPKLKIVRHPISFFLATLSLLAPTFSEHLLKLPFINGTLYFTLKKNFDYEKEKI